MFKTVIRLAALSMARKFMGVTAASSRAPIYSPVRPNTDLIKTLAVRYLTFSVLAFLNFLLFVGGLVVTAVAVAHSFDVYNQFQTTSVFWTGLIIMFTGLALSGVCGWALISTKVKPEDLVVMDPSEEPLTIADRLVRPIFEGFLAGLARPHTRHEPERAREYPAA